MRTLLSAILIVTSINLATASPSENLDPEVQEHLQSLDLDEQKALICNYQTNQSVQILMGRYNGISKHELTELVLSYHDDNQDYFTGLFPDIDQKTYEQTENDISHIIAKAYRLPFPNDEESQLAALETFAEQNLENCLMSIGLYPH